MRSLAAASSSSVSAGLGRGAPAASVLMAYRPKARALFIYGFAKNERENIEEDELATLRDIAEAWLEADAGRIQNALAEGVILEVQDDQPILYFADPIGYTAGMNRDSRPHPVCQLFSPHPSARRWADGCA